MHRTAYGKNVMNISWLPPRQLFADYFTYTVTALVNDSGEVIMTDRVSFLQDDIPLYTLHLVGLACEHIQIIVSLLGKENEGLTITEALPSCEWVPDRKYFLFMLICMYRSFSL